MTVDLMAFARAVANGDIRVIDLTQTLSQEFPTIVLPPELGQCAPFRMEEVSRYDERGPAWYWNNISRVEMRSGMLAETDVVPEPSRSAFVVPRHLLHSERRALPQLGWQHNGREFLRQRLRQVDDTDVAAGDRARKGHEIDCH